MKGITAPPRVIQLWPVDTARSTVKPHPRNRTVSANPCSVFTNMPLGDTQSQTCPPVLAQKCAPHDLASDLERRSRCAPPAVSRRRCDNQRRTVTCAEEINQAARNQTVDAPSVHQQNARWKTPVHAHGANNHTMDTTGPCHPQKLRWHALTWKPTANGPSSTNCTSLAHNHEVLLSGSHVA